ncbi:hypothetical protein DP923_13560 [Pontibacter arcticus]|uniref:Outer membrane protein beta-barrel domain-containing protein n=2 Tax=Pontibacter arcticus TaxID=2080288 RepID=A0A364RC38_9BACT|nr:hypothetical protein DP923_13560 [Pontibacter arcticus]
MPAYTFAQTDTTTIRKWYAPDGLTVQFAGNIGMFAAGANYSFSKDKINAELLYGYVPSFDAEESLHLLTLKGIYKPFKKVELGNDFKLTPLRTNLALTYHFRSQFSTSWDNAYPENYYWWISSLRLTGGLGSEISHPLPKNGLFKDITLYGEVGTYDLILTSALKDKTLTGWDIISFSVGLKAGF